jgi:hypothetical protein
MLRKWVEIRVNAVKFNQKVVVIRKLRMCVSIEVYVLMKVHTVIDKEPKRWA